MKFQTLLDKEWQRGLDENPIYASYMGDKRANQDWPDISETAVRDRQNKVRDVLQELKSIDPKLLPETQQLNYRLFLYNYERAVFSPENLIPIFSYLDKEVVFNWSTKQLKGLLFKLSKIMKIGW